MELKEKACEEILRHALETFDGVEEQEGGIKDWRAIFEAAFQCLLTLQCTEAIQLFACMCICALDFESYSQLEDVLLSHEKTVPMMNTFLYRQLNESEEKSE